jgi:N-acetylglucosamine repressor
MLVSQLHPSAQTPADIRQRNRFAVLRLLRDHGPLAKSDLVQLTARTNTTIATILDGLLAERLVEVVDAADQIHLSEPTRGRPAIQYRLCNEYWLAAGIQITSNCITGAIMQLDGAVIIHDSVAAAEDMSPDRVLTLAGDLIDDLMEHARPAGRVLLGIGISLEGFANTETGESLWMLFRSGWQNVPVQKYFEDRFRLPAVIDYRVYAAALAEASYGAARDIPDFVYLNIDTGIATATVASGLLVRGSTQPAGVTGGLGHVITGRSQKLCFCGNVGCLHNEITAQALVLQLRELLKLGSGHGVGRYWETHKATFKNLIEAVHERDALALQLRDRFSENLTIAASSAVQLFGANLLIIGGPTMQFGGQQALDAAQRAVGRLSILHERLGETRVVASTLAPDAATVGAATLVVHAVMNGQIGALQV